MSSIMMFAIVVILASLGLSYFLLFQHIKESTLRKDFVLSPKGDLDPSGVASRSFQLKQAGGIGRDISWGLNVVLIVTVLIGVGGGGLTIEYFIRKGHLATPQTLFISAAAAMLFFLTLLYFAMKAIRHFLKIMALAKLTKGKEVIFNQDQVLFSIGLVYSNHQDQLVKRNQPYLEIPYSSVEEVQVHQGTQSSRRYLASRFTFIVFGEKEPISILRTELGENHDAILAELRLRINRKFALIDHLQAEKDKLS